MVTLVTISILNNLTPSVGKFLLRRKIITRQEVNNYFWNNFLIIFENVLDVANILKHLL